MRPPIGKNSWPSWASSPTPPKAFLQGDVTRERCDFGGVPVRYAFKGVMSSLSALRQACKTLASRPTALSPMKCCRLRLRNSSCTRHSALGTSEVVVATNSPGALLCDANSAQASKHFFTPFKASIIWSCACTCSFTSLDLRLNCNARMCAFILRPRSTAKRSDKLTPEPAPADFKRKPCLTAWSHEVGVTMLGTPQDEVGGRVGELSVFGVPGWLKGPRRWRRNHATQTSCASNPSASMSRMPARAFTMFEITAKASSMEIRSSGTLSFANSCLKMSLVTHPKGSKPVAETSRVLSM
mmetsp:Transcript_29496/g.84816  ORF Transcript_29496/g.84816 Transcript_29496/m.84816 type:complete len:298 (+) Transcript_29496:357-1250(+)